MCISAACKTLGFVNMRRKIYDRLRLQPNEDRTVLKCYFCDTGLLISLAFGARGVVTNEIYQKLMFDKLEIDEGMLVKNVVAQMLKASGNELFFFSNYDKEDAENRMRIDFLIQKELVTQVVEI